MNNKKAPIMELMLQELNDAIMFENSFDTLFERLEIASILALPDETLADAKLLLERMEEPKVLPVTHKLMYRYDYGDN